MTTDEPTTPLSDERLTAIRSRVSAFRRSPDEASFLLKMDARSLLAEVDRLHREVAAAELNLAEEGQRVEDARIQETAAILALRLSRHREQEALPFLQELAKAHNSMLDDDDVIIKVSPGRAAWVISRAKAFIEKVEQAHAALAAADAPSGEGE